MLLDQCCLCLAKCSITLYFFVYISSIFPAGFSTLSETACKGLLCIVRKKQHELKHLMQLVRAGYMNIFSKDMVSEESELEHEEEVQEELSESNSCSDDE